jgi:hypothetical protein
MGHGAITRYTVTMASGATLTPVADLSRGWTRVYLDPTGAASEVRIQAAGASGDTYRQVYQPSVNSSTAAANIFKIPSSVSGGLIEIPPGLRYVKVETTAAVTNGNQFILVCSD